MGEKSKAAAQGTSGGIGVSGLLFVALVILKLTHQIDISWVMVCAAPLALIAGIFVAFLAVFAIVTGVVILWSLVFDR